MDNIMYQVELFFEAQRTAEKQGEHAFTCPLCGGEASWIRSSEYGHLRCGCQDCGFYVME